MLYDNANVCLLHTISPRKRDTGLAAGSHGKNCVEHVVPDLARHAEAQVEILVVMREVVTLHLADIRGKPRVVESMGVTG